MGVRRWIEPTAACQQRSVGCRGFAGKDPGTQDACACVCLRTCGYTLTFSSSWSKVISPSSTKLFAFETRPSWFESSDSARMVSDCFTGSRFPSLNPNPIPLPLLLPPARSSARATSDTPRRAQDVDAPAHLAAQACVSESRAWHATPRGDRGVPCPAGDDEDIAAAAAAATRICVVAPPRQMSLAPPINLAPRMDAIISLSLSLPRSPAFARVLPRQVSRDKRTR